MAETEVLRVGIVTVSDRASTGTYRDTSGPAIEEFLREVVTDVLARADAARARWHRQRARRSRRTGRPGKMRPDIHHRWHWSGAARSHAGSHPSRLRASDAGLRRVDALGEPETGADRDPVAANCRHPRQDLDRQSARPAKLDPLYVAGGISSNPLLPRPDRRGAHRHRPTKCKAFRPPP